MSGSVFSAKVVHYSTQINNRLLDSFVSESYSVIFDLGGKLNPDTFTQCPGGALQGQERDGNVIRVEQPL